VRWHEVSMRKVAISIIVIGQLVVACGSDNSTPPRYVTGVTASGPVASLDNGQLQQICSSFDAYVNTNIGFDQIAYIACLPPAIVLGGGTAGCKQQLASCMAAFPPPVSVQAQVHDPQVCFQNLQECQASVSALENCVNVNFKTALDILDNWSCSSVNDANVQKAAAHAMDTVNVCGQADAACNRFATLGPD
jgi:hypothetical protein